MYRRQDYYRRNRFRELWEDNREIIIMVLTLIFIVGGFLSLPYFIGKNSCLTYINKFNVDAVWNFWTGCMAKHPQFGYLPIDEYFRVINIYNP